MANFSSAIGDYSVLQAIRTGGGFREVSLRRCAAAAEGGGHLPVPLAVLTSPFSHLGASDRTDFSGSSRASVLFSASPCLGCLSVENREKDEGGGISGEYAMSFEMERPKAADFHLSCLAIMREDRLGYQSGTWCPTRSIRPRRRSGDTWRRTSRYPLYPIFRFRARPVAHDIFGGASRMRALGYGASNSP